MKWLDRFKRMFVTDECTLKGHAKILVLRKGYRNFKNSIGAERVRSSHYQCSRCDRELSKPKVQGLYAVTPADIERKLSKEQRDYLACAGEVWTDGVHRTKRLEKTRRQDKIPPPAF